ncbi:ATP synthase I chain [Mariprofundus ferrinatatus]|uniref:ATP synthase I chain n=1 Tax=Mariprofundus ferrinatatus TaxID=1921087 RepID=A0A2K8LEF0_9PROT|nr:ATP synthase subunit I [Mariprofundus ferrinatatus]ATX82656.1 ATP synthase I chain [Mariprofundus ferrinatatus]
MSLVKVAAVSRIVRQQLLVGLLGFVVLALFGQIEGALSLAFGVAVMVVNAIWLARRLDRTQGMDIDSGKRSIYTGAVLRFVAMIAALSIAYLAGLHLLFVAAGIFAAQAVVFISAIVSFRKEQKGEGLG